MCLSSTKEHEFKGKKCVLRRKGLYLKGIEIDVQKGCAIGDQGKRNFVAMIKDRCETHRESEVQAERKVYRCAYQKSLHLQLEGDGAVTLRSDMEESPSILQLSLYQCFDTIAHVCKQKMECQIHQSKSHREIHYKVPKSSSLIMSLILTANVRMLTVLAESDA